MFNKVSAKDVTMRQVLYLGYLTVQRFKVYNGSDELLCDESDIGDVEDALDRLLGECEWDDYFVDYIDVDEAGCFGIHMF